MKQGKLSKFFGEPIEVEIEGEPVKMAPPMATDISTIMEITFLVDKLNTSGSWTPEEGKRFMDLVVRFVYDGLKDYYDISEDDVKRMRPEIVLSMFRARASVGGIEVSENFRPDDYIRGKTSPRPKRGRRGAHN